MNDYWLFTFIILIFVYREREVTESVTKVLFFLPYREKLNSKNITVTLKERITAL